MCAGPFVLPQCEDCCVTTITNTLPWHAATTNNTTTMTADDGGDDDGNGSDDCGDDGEGEDDERPRQKANLKFGVM